VACNHTVDTVSAVQGREHVRGEFNELFQTHDHPLVVDGWRTSVHIGHCVIHCLCTDLGPYDSIRSMHLQSRRNKRSIHHWWCVDSVRAMTARRHSEHIVQPTHAQLARGTHSQTTKRYADAHMQRGFVQACDCGRESTHTCMRTPTLIKLGAQSQCHTPAVCRSSKPCTADADMSQLTSAPSTASLVQADYRFEI
jgi:hypothetical protein